MSRKGPFGEWTGYYSGGTEPVLTMDIERVYHRDDPILLGAPPGKPPHDYSYMRSVMKSAMIQDALVAHRAAGRRRACGRTRSAADGSCSPSSINQQYAGHARQAGYLTVAAAVGGVHEQVRRSSSTATSTRAASTT